MHKDLIIVEQEIGSDYKDTTFDYKGYVIEEHYFAEEDCTHHSAVVFLGGQVLTKFRWEGCLEKAMEFVDAREDAKKYDSEGLKALKRIRQETCPATYNPDFNKLECCDVIEKELKRLEEIDDILNTGGGIWAENGIVSKKLKALEIVKKYIRVDKPFNMACYIYLNDESEMIAEEEYDLLKEVGL